MTMKRVQRKSKIKKTRSAPISSKPKLARAEDFIGRLNGQLQIVGDITSPIYRAEAWTGDIENLDKKPEPQS